MSPLERARLHAERAEAAYESCRAASVWTGSGRERLDIERRLGLMWAQLSLAEAPSVDATVLAVDYGYPDQAEPVRQPEKAQETPLRRAQGRTLITLQEFESLD